MLKRERQRRKLRIRAKLGGTAERPRLSVFRSNKCLYAQVIDDDKGATLVEAHGVDARKVGEQVAEKMLKKKIGEAVLDRSGYRYHGKVKELAEAAREKGVKI